METWSLPRRSFTRLIEPQELLNAGDMEGSYSRICCGRRGVIKLEWVNVSALVICTRTGRIWPPASLLARTSQHPSDSFSNVRNQTESLDDFRGNFSARDCLKSRVLRSHKFARAVPEFRPNTTRNISKTKGPATTQYTQKDEPPGA